VAVGSHIGDSIAVRTIALLAIVWTTLALPAPAMAQDGGPGHAGLIVRHGDGRITYVVVAFAEDELNGIELLERSGLEAVTIPFGGLGEGVCSLEGEGCGVSECRRLCQTGGSDSPYWRYFGLDASGAWAAFELGASTAEVHDGDVQLWSWSPDDAGIAPVALAEIERLSGYAANQDDGGPWVATLYPEGMGPEEEGEQPWPVYLAAGGVIVAIGVAALVSVRRHRATSPPADAE
jgi:hypothetical protein